MRKINPTTAFGICRVCASPFEFLHIGGRHQRFCSEACKSARTAEQTAASKARLVAGERRNRPAEYIRPRKRHDFTCEQCGLLYKAALSHQGNRFCGPRCHDDWHLARNAAIAQAKRQDVTCPTCGVAFRQEFSRHKYCSWECRKIPEWSTKTHERRTKTAFAPVNPYVVFTRDGWTCKLCGCDTPRALRGTFVPNAPELDHIIPLALGGEHSYENTQCACRACNGSKGAKAA